MGLLSRDFRLKVLGYRVRRGFNSLFSGLIVNCFKRWFKLSKVEIDVKILFVYCRGSYLKV